MNILANVELTSRTIREDTQIVAGTLVIPAGTVIRVLDCNLEIRCETLIVQGSVFFDGHGENGRDGMSPDPLIRMPGWISGLHHDDHRRRHDEWVIAIDTPNPDEYGLPATPGTNGQAGARIFIYYRKLGDGTQLGLITRDINGGRGGRAAQGGLGRTLICGSPSHSGHEQWRRPDGQGWPGGSDGLPGTWRLERIPD